MNNRNNRPERSRDRVRNDAYDNSGRAASSDMRDPVETDRSDRPSTRRSDQTRRDSRSGPREARSDRA